MTESTAELFDQGQATKVLDLYGFQETAVDGLRDNIRAGVTNQVLCAPTGAGKTIMATHLLAEAMQKGRRAVFCADRVSLIHQTSAVLDAYGIDHGVIQGDHWRWRPHKQIQVASPQTLARRTWPDPLDLIVVDECHTLHRTVLRKIKERGCVTVGLTATPFRKGLGKYYDAVVTAKTTSELIQEGYLAPYRIFAASEPDMEGAKTNSTGEWHESEAANRAIPIVGDAVQEYLKHGGGQKFIAFCADTRHCQEMRKAFEAAGVRCASVTYRTPAGEEEDVIAEFRRADSSIRGLVSVSKISKGFDVEDVGVVILARPLRKSLAEHIQAIGRGLRRDPANPEKVCTILDHAGNTLRFWGAMNAFFEDGVGELDDGKPKEKKAKKTDKEDVEGRKCPDCHHVHAPRPYCPNCGHEYPMRSDVQQVAGELEEIGSGGGTTQEERVRLYAQLLYMAKEKRYKPGWAAHKYKERIGLFPPRHWNPPPERPSRELRRWVKSRVIAWAKAQKKGGS